eukprot:GEMP01077685.1.p2 GENE.GEMP01077685.1~~GEMP01077685.1.p2  ORF type:complete len:102 (-),score=20.68 GEMP01077685.1:569-874(-)
MPYLVFSADASMAETSRTSCPRRIHFCHSAMRQSGALTDVTARPTSMRDAPPPWFAPFITVHQRAPLHVEVTAHDIAARIIPYVARLPLATVVCLCSGSAS